MNFAGAFLKLTLTIWSAALAAIGGAFVVVGLLASGSVEVFRTIGIALVAAGILAGLVAYLLHRQQRGQAARRTAKTQAKIVDLQASQGSRVGANVPVKMTIELSTVHAASGNRYIQRVLVSPLTQVSVGGTVEVAYEPENPANWVLLQSMQGEAHNSVTKQ